MTENIDKKAQDDVEGSSNYISLLCRALARQKQSEGKYMDFESKYLNDKQRKTAKEFLKTRSKPSLYLEEDCCGSRDYHYEIRPSGIGDSVHLVCGKNRIWLDDGLES